MTSTKIITDSNATLARAAKNSDERLAQFLATEWIRRALGEGETEILDNKPHTRFFVGTLAHRMTDPETETELPPDKANVALTEAEGDSLGERTGTALEFNPPIAEAREPYQDDVDSGALLMGERRVSPPSCGLRFRLASMEGTLGVHVRFHVWARAMPTAKQLEPYGGKDLELRDIPTRFVHAGTVDESGELRLNQAEEDAAVFTRRINDALALIAQTFSERPDCYRSNSGRRLVPEEAAERQVWLDRLGGLRFMPWWKAELSVSTRSAPGGRGTILDLRFVNLTSFPRDRAKLHEGTLFNATLEVETAGAPVQPWEAGHFKSGDPRRPQLRPLAAGLACVAEELAGRPSVVVTRHVPVHGQAPIDQARRPGTNVEELARDPAASAQKFLDALRETRPSWDAMLGRFDQRRNPEAYGRAREDMDAFEKEVADIARAVEILRGTDTESRRVQEAFRYTMEAMSCLMTKSMGVRPEWRAFQLGFILSALPRVVERARYTRTAGGQAASYEPRADLIWFRTGGGKTEAFQALAVFNAFYDRLRGKKGGVTAWFRFALRALTVQQTERLVHLVYHADQIRKERKVPGPEFRVGFLVGGAYTPTEVKPPEPGLEDDEQRENTNIAIARKIAMEPRAFVFVAKCPLCRQVSIRSEWSEHEWNITFHCRTEGCKAGRMPMDVIDDNIRRNPPAFLVGTIDKITGVGLTRKVHTLLRTPPWRCPQHGFVRPDFSKRNRGRCTHESPARCQLLCEKFTAPYDWAPGLVVIDEVHLLEEELGAFSGHYESILQKVSLLGGDPAPYYVLASATVAGWEQHVRHLTGVRKDRMRRFPSSPPTELSGFYFQVKTEDVQRFFVGIHPHGKTENDALIHTLRILHSILQELDDGRIPLETVVGHAVASPAEKAEILLPYRRTITYVLALRQGDGVRHSIDFQLSQYMLGGGYEPLRASDTISSKMESHTLADLLTLLDRPDPQADQDYDVVPASSSIAYGVDIKNINNMVLMGQPRRTSEDIQVTSRTGRRFTGLVFRLFHPVRQRDLVHYLHFHTYHHNQDLLVEEVAINRFSTKTPRRTIGGAIMSLIFSTEEDRQGDSNPGWFLLQAKELVNRAREWFEARLREMYMVSDPDASPAFRAAVEEAIEINLNLVARAVRESPAGGTPGALDSSPMTSLRDVDEGIEIMPYQGREEKGSTLDDARLRGRTMTRSRIQVIYNHAPDQTYEFGNGSAIVRTQYVDRAFNPGGVENINRVVMASRLLPLLRGAPELMGIVYAKDAADKLANNLEPVRPGRIKAALFPLTFRCRFRSCQQVWLANSRTMRSLRCPRDPAHGPGQQVRHMAVHDECGEAQSLYVPGCPEHGSAWIQLNDRPQSTSSWRWWCRVPGCSWTRNVTARCLRCNPAAAKGDRA